MLVFRKLVIEDKTWMDGMFADDQKPACEFTFANNLLWSKIYNVQVTQSHGCGLLRYEEEEGTTYVYPIGGGDKRAAMEALLEYTKVQGQKMILTGLMMEEMEQLEQWFPGVFVYRKDRDYYDYIYNTSDLVNLPGKKYHGKRNHIARFRDHMWNYEEITKDNVNECVQMLMQWRETRIDKWNQLMEEEYSVVQDALCLYDVLGLTGGLIRRKGEVVGFSLGEQLTSDMFVVHFEKAYPEIQGAYPMINQQFVEHACPLYQYINREEDDGEEGLRKAKLSYYPTILLEKYHAREK